MTVDDKLINEILKNMGVDPNGPSKWIPQMHKTQITGFICGRCGIHSYTKKLICPGCKCKMEN